MQHGRVGSSIARAAQLALQVTAGPSSLHSTTDHGDSSTAHGDSAGLLLLRDTREKPRAAIRPGGWVQTGVSDLPGGSGERRGVVHLSGAPSKAPSSSIGLHREEEAGDVSRRVQDAQLQVHRNGHEMPQETAPP